jgi:hypothetical protein
MGARFTPCMKTGTGFENLIFECRQSYGITGSLVNGTMCVLADLCALNGGQNQFYRFIVPIFLHGGVLHFLFNMSFQVRTGVDMERDVGTLRIALIYMASGVGGFIFGANFSGIRGMSVGCSGSLYGERGGGVGGLHSSLTRYPGPGSSHPPPTHTLPPQASLAACCWS